MAQITSRNGKQNSNRETRITILNAHMDAHWGSYRNVEVNVCDH